MFGGTIAQISTCSEKVWSKENRGRRGSQGKHSYLWGEATEYNIMEMNIQVCVGVMWDYGDCPAPVSYLKVEETMSRVLFDQRGMPS